MFDSVNCTSAAPNMKTFLKREPGQELMSHPSIDCCTNGAISRCCPTDLDNGPFDVHRADIVSVPYKNQSSTTHWQHMQLITEGHGHTFSPKVTTTRPHPLQASHKVRKG